MSPASLPTRGSYAKLAEWAASRQRLGMLFLGYLQSLNWEGVRLWEKDIVAWYVEEIESQLDTEEQLDDQVKMAKEVVQWLIEEDHVDLTERGLELVALAPFRQASLSTVASCAGFDGFDGFVNPGIDWTRTTKGGNSAARKRAQRAKRQ